MLYHKMAKDFYDNKEYEKAYEMYEKLAPFGDIIAKSNLALCKLEGKGCQKNVEEAFELMRNTECGIAKFLQADCYHHGIGVTKNIPIAIRCYNKAKELGHPKAQAKIDGISYETVLIEECPICCNRDQGLMIRCTDSTFHLVCKTCVYEIYKVLSTDFTIKCPFCNENRDKEIIIIPNGIDTFHNYIDKPLFESYSSGGTMKCPNCSVESDKLNLKLLRCNDTVVHIVCDGCSENPKIEDDYFLVCPICNSTSTQIYPLLLCKGI